MKSADTHSEELREKIEQTCENACNNHATGMYANLDNKELNYPKLVQDLIVLFTNQLQKEVEIAEAIAYDIAYKSAVNQLTMDGYHISELELELAKIEAKIEERGEALAEINNEDIHITIAENHLARLSELTKQKEELMK